MKIVKQIAKWGKDNEVILKTLVLISIFLLLYNFVYIYNYYTRSNIFFHTPNIVDGKKVLLDPNEIGDSIGGILNPLIGFTACILTFLAFYIQYRANETQRELFEKELTIQNDKAKSEIIEGHKTNLKVVKALINSTLEHCVNTAPKMNDFIEIETKSPLSINNYYYISNASYDNFQKLDFTKLYSSIIYNFVDSKEDWEKEFIDTLSNLDFYNKLIIEVNEANKKNIQNKVECLSEQGKKLMEVMGEVILHPNLQNFKSLVAYYEIVYHRDFLGNIIPHDPLKEIDFDELQIKFIAPFIDELSVLFTSSRNTLLKEILLKFYAINKEIGAAKSKSLLYASELKKIHNTYFKTR